MAAVFQTERVTYECICGEWAPLCRLFFCRHCSEMRCSSCAANEIDCTFCGTCLENVPVGEARVRKNRCINCHQCPFCAMTLVAHSTGQSTVLKCATCRWSTHDSDIQEQAAVSNWQIHENAYEAELNTVLEQMRNYEQNEKAAKDLSKRRLVGSRFSDRYGMQHMYQKKRAAIERPTWLAPEHLPTDVEELPEEFFSQAPDLSRSLPLEARLRQPLAAEEAARPVRMPLKSRRVLRCAKCAHNISKLEYSPSTIAFKIQAFARNCVPVIRLSRETLLTANSTCPVFLSISNESAAKADVLLIADNEVEKAEGGEVELSKSSFVHCETPVVELSLPSADGTANLYGTDNSQANFGNTGSPDAIVFTKNNRAGIRLDVKVGESDERNQLCLLLKWQNELTAQQASNASEMRTTRVKIALGKS